MVKGTRGDLEKSFETLPENIRQYFEDNGFSPLQLSIVMAGRQLLGLPPEIYDWECLEAHTSEIFRLCKGDGSNYGTAIDYLAETLGI